MGRNYLEADGMCLGRGGRFIPLVMGRGTVHPPYDQVHARRIRNMPTYDYSCQKCGHTFQRTEKITEHGEKKVRCPDCKSTRVTQVFGSVFVKTAKKS